tara:strand:+ start:176 stop:1060 length:885 start_codon:yes stop_codon:yes gene_type:complete
MTNKKNAKNANEFSCETCHFICSNRYDYKRHLSTRKHEILTNPNKKNPKNALLFFCDCGKQYKHRSSLSSHKKKCNHESNNSCTEITQEIDYKSLLIKAMNQLQEQQEEMKKKDEMMANMIDKIGNTTNNTTNNLNHFNINMFLNEKCKDAINFSDFIERIEVSHDDLENNAQLGFVNGITKIIMDNLNQLTLYERPIHCTDIKRETLYIKDSDKWEKEQSDKKIEGAIQEVSRKSIGSLLQWKKENPDYEDIDSEFSNKCIVMQQQSSGYTNRELSYSKIVHNLARENFVKKG